MIVIYSNYSNTWIIQVGCHQDSRQTPGAATGEVGHAGQRAEGGAGGPTGMENPRKNTGKSRKIMGFDGLWVMDDLSSW
jgi:hypothetical protein